MRESRRPLADKVEVGAPHLAAFVARILGLLPERIRRKALHRAFDRARDAFNRGDLEAVFALFAPDVEYGPPPPLHEGAHLRGREAVFAFWRAVLSRYDENSIVNVSVDEASPERFVRHARLHHHSSVTGETLDYSIVQTTELTRGQVTRQVNTLLAPEHATG